MSYYNQYYPYQTQPMPDQLAQLRASQSQPMYQPQYLQPQNDGGINWVLGEEAAKSYLVAPGNTVQLWDRNQQTIYIKSVDLSGVPSFRVIDYIERSPNAIPQRQNADAVSREEFNALSEKFRELSEKFNLISANTEG